MAVRSGLFFFVVFLGSSFSWAAADVQARWCVLSDQEQRKCEAMTTAFNGAGLKQLGCVQAIHKYECMRMLKEGEAELIRLDDTDIFAAGKFYGLIPILKESTAASANEESYLYKAVIVLRSDSPITTVDGLYQRKSCHTGVGRTVGWTVPVANLQARGVMEVRDCDNTVKNVATFFSESCAPGAYTQENNYDGDNPANVCLLCKNKRCPTDDTYSSYKGSLQCLLDDQGEVAFVKHSTIADLAKTDPTFQKENFQLLCPDSTRKHVDEWANCNWATRPTDAIMTSPLLPASSISAIRDLLDRGSRSFGSDSSNFNMFNSSQFQGTNLMFTDGTTKLFGVGSSDYRDYVGQGFLATMVNYTSCPWSERWCVVTQAEEDKCWMMAAAFASSRITQKMSCVRAQSHTECMEKIQAGKADLVTLDGGDVYLAGKHHDLVPIVAENYMGDNLTSYYAVAVVRASNSGVNINNLKGKTSCHTGIQKTSGWNIPIGTLIEKGQIARANTKCGVVKAVGNFFSKSCVPGALDPKYNPTGSNPESLCELCGGKTSCQRSSANKYYNYKGAFRCLVEKNADVAFVKHSTVKDYTDGKTTEEWSRNLRSADFELLCPDGTRRPVREWRECNLAKVASHAVVTSKKKSQLERDHYFTILQKGQMLFGKDSSTFEMFSATSGSDAIFDEATSFLSKIEDFKQDYISWLGQTYVGAMSALDVNACTGGCDRQCPSLVYIIASALLCFFLVKK